MKLLTFEREGKAVPGVLSACGKYVCPLSAFGIGAETLEQYIFESDRAALNDLNAKVAAGGIADKLPLDAVKLLAPIPAPRQQLFCMENNYYASNEEKEEAIATGTAPALPTFYWKKATAASGTGAAIPSYPEYVKELDYEPGIAFITAADVRNVPYEDATRYILGYTIVNNVIARDLHRRHRRPVLATSLDGFLPMGPWITTADEFGREPVFRLETRVNGELVQCCSTELRKFTPEWVVSDVSRLSLLKAASIFWTGTPFGCGKDQDPPRWLRRGDVVECTVEGLGTLTNTVV